MLPDLQAGNTLTQLVHHAKPVIARNEGRLLLDVLVLALANDGVGETGTGREDLHPDFSCGGLRERFYCLDPQLLGATKAG